MSHFTITRISNPRETLPIRPRSATECKIWFINNFPRFYTFDLWEETADGKEIYIVISSATEHMRFHAKREN